MTSAWPWARALATVCDGTGYPCPDAAIQFQLRHQELLFSYFEYVGQDYGAAMQKMARTQLSGKI